MGVVTYLKDRLSRFIESGRKPTLDQLRAVHPEYKRRKAAWEFNLLAYEGGEAFTDTVLQKHERESDDNLKARRRESVNFGYTESTVNIFNHFLFEPGVTREGPFETDFRWKRFLADCDREGNGYDHFLEEAQKISGVCGTSGILIDMPKGQVSMEDPDVRPYLIFFPPLCILDWKFTRELRTGRRVLSYLKLWDADRWLIWRLDRWDAWRIEGGMPDGEGKSMDAKVVSAGGGKNRLGEIPFTWLPNLKVMKKPWDGKEDIREIARVQASIVRNMSYGEEILKLAGFPMLRMPMKDMMEYDEELEGSDSTEMEGFDKDEVAVGNRAVLEFNPEHKDYGKSDWLATQVLDPIRALLEWIDRKTDEMYRVASLGGVYQQRDKAQTKSGKALYYDFLILSAILAKKAGNVEMADRKILYFYCRWLKLSTEGIAARRPRNFAIEDLINTLEAAVTGLGKIKSEKFRYLMKLSMVRQLLPNISDGDLESVTEQLADETSRETAALMSATDRGETVPTDLGVDAVIDRAKEGADGGD